MHVRSLATRFAFLAPLALFAVLAPAAGTSQQSYHVTRRIPVGMDGGWDYLTVDTAGHRLFVSHGTRVNVVDLLRDTLTGQIPYTPGVHGIALALELGRGFVSDGRDSTVTVFDLRTLDTLKRVAVGARNPDAILYEPTSRRVLTFNGGSANATLIDAAADTVVGHIDLGGKPEFAVADGRGRWPLAPCEEPSGLALDRAHRRLFSVCGNRTMVVSDADRRRVVASVPIGSGVDGVAFDAERGLAFSSNGEGTLTVVREDSPDRYSVVATVPTARGARTIALDPSTHRLSLPTAQCGPAPAPTADNPRPRPAIVSGSFTVLVVEP